jgi:hypothetical protein
MNCLHTIEILIAFACSNGVAECFQVPVSLSHQVMHRLVGLIFFVIQVGSFRIGIEKVKHFYFCIGIEKVKRFYFRMFERLARGCRCKQPARLDGALGT